MNISESGGYRYSSIEYKSLTNKLNLIEDSLKDFVEYEKVNDFYKISNRKPVEECQCIIYYNKRKDNYWTYFLLDGYMKEKYFKGDDVSGIVIIFRNEKEENETDAYVEWKKSISLRGIGKCYVINLNNTFEYYSDYEDEFYTDVIHELNHIFQYCSNYYSKTRKRYLNNNFYNEKYDDINYVIDRITYEYNQNELDSKKQSVLYLIDNCECLDRYKYFKFIEKYEKLENIIYFFIKKYINEFKLYSYATKDTSFIKECMNFVKKEYNIKGIEIIAPVIYILFSEKYKKGGILKDCIDNDEDFYIDDNELYFVSDFTGKSTSNRDSVLVVSMLKKCILIDIRNLTSFNRIYLNSKNKNR